MPVPLPADHPEELRLSDGAYCQVDLARPEAAEAISHFLDERGINRLDILIHNAAVGWYGPIAEQSAAAIAEALAANLRAPIALTHALLPRVTAAHGVVAFVSSVHASLPTPDFTVYTATKAALDGFARNMRIEQAGEVDVLTLWAGPTRTGMHTKSGVPAGRLKVERFAPPGAARRSRGPSG